MFKSKKDEVFELLKQGLTDKEIIDKGISKLTLYKWKKVYNETNEKHKEVKSVKKVKEVIESEDNILHNTPDITDGNNDIYDNKDDKEIKTEPEEPEPEKPVDEGDNPILKFFRNSVPGSIKRTDVKIQYEDETKEEKGKSRLFQPSNVRISDSIKDLFSLVAVIRKRDYWELNDTEVKQINKICPVINKFDKLAQLFGKYGCMIAFIVIILKRLVAEYEEYEKEHKKPKIPVKVIEEKPNEEYIKTSMRED